MRTVVASVASLILLAVFGSLIGCEQPKVAPVAAPSTPSAEGSDDLAALSPADREAALAQKICPVSGEPLGSMGTPPKVVVEGREVFLCCASCEKPLLDDPAKYLAKLDK